MKTASVAFVRTQGNALCVCVCVCVCVCGREGGGGFDLPGGHVLQNIFNMGDSVSPNPSLSTAEVFSRKPLQEEWLPGGNYAGGHSPLRLAADFS